MRPFLNNDELMLFFDQQLPAHKDTLKIVVAETDNRIVFSLHLFIEESNATNKTKIGHIHDLLMNRNCYGSLEDPNAILGAMITSLE